jgi:hypothetical protein
MMKLFGFSKKEKVTVDGLARLYANTLFEVVDQGFSEIIGFVNDNRKFEESPNLQKEDVKWFLMVIFAANNHRLSEFFPDTVVDKMHEACTQEIIAILGEEEEIIRDMIVDYEVFFAEQLSQASRLEKAMARSIFIKYNLNDYQGKLLKNQNEPNPVFLQELTNLLSHFVWNWDDYLSKYKVVS